MYRILTAFAICFSLSACVTPPPRAYTPAPVINTQAPQCSGKSQCAALWVDAQRTIEAVTGMRVHMVTDGRITTFPAVGYSRLGGEVTKRPISDSTYELRAYFECYRNTECSDLRASATNLFNTMLGGAPMPVATVAPAKEAKRGCDLAKNASGELALVCPE